MAARYFVKPSMLAARVCPSFAAAPVRMAVVQPQRLSSLFWRAETTFRLRAYASAARASEATSIYVGNLPYTVDDRDLREWFSEVGEIAEVRFGMRDGRRAGYAHVDFVNPGDAAKAVTFDGEELDGRPLRIDISERRSATVPRGDADGLTCFVKGFDQGLDSNDVRVALQEAFGEYGEIKDMMVPYDRERQQLKGFALVQFAQPGSNVKAAEGLSGALVAGGSLVVDPNASSLKRSSASNVSNAVQQSDGKTIYVRGFDPQLGEDTIREELTAAFSPFGRVTELRLPFDRDNNCVKNFCYVVFESADGTAARAAAEMANVSVAGGSLFIDPNPRPARTQGGGGRGGGARMGGRGGGYNDRRSDRGGYNDRRGDRGGYNDRRSDRGGYDRRGGDGYSRRNDYDSY